MNSAKVVGSRRPFPHLAQWDAGTRKVTRNQVHSRPSLNVVRRFHSLKERHVMRGMFPKVTNTHLPKDVFCRLPQYPVIDDKVLGRTSFRQPIYKTIKPFAPVVVDLARSKFTVNRLKCLNMITALRSSPNSYNSTTFSMTIRAPFVSHRSSDITCVSCDNTCPLHVHSKPLKSPPN